MTAPDDEDGADAICERCGEPFNAGDASVEAWESLDMFVCPECASEALGELGEEA